MYGLENQRIEQALHLKQAIDLGLRIYLVSINDRTKFFFAQPLLPKLDDIVDMQIEGQTLLEQKGLDNMKFQPTPNLL